MKVLVTGAGGTLGGGIAARLANAGHQIVGLDCARPENWPSAAQFIEADIRDAGSVRLAIADADVVAHCSWMVSGRDERLARDVNVGGTSNLLEAMTANGTRRVVFASSVDVYGPRASGSPLLTERDNLAPTAEHVPGIHRAEVETMLAASQAEWVTIRSGIIVGRDVDNRMLRLLAAPVLPIVAGSENQSLQAVHTDDVYRVFIRAILDSTIKTGAINLAAPGVSTIREMAVATGRPIVPVPKWIIDTALAPFGQRRLAAPLAGGIRLIQSFPLMDTALLHDEWGYTPVWSASECVEDLALAVRGRVALGKKAVPLPWRLPRVQSIPAADAAAADGVAPVLVGPSGANGEFDTPIDPRFPAFIASNLSEALPGPFSPASLSVTVRGARAGGVTIAERLRPGGVVQREMATRTVGVFGHRLYGGITSAHFMAETVPFTDPKMVLGQFFGQTVSDITIFGAQRPPQPRGGAMRQLRNIAVFGGNLVGLSAGSTRDTQDFILDIDRLETLAGKAISDSDERRLLSVIMLARDHIVQGWVLSAASFMLCSAYGVLLRLVSGRDTTPIAGPELASARSVDAVRRLVAAARRDPSVVGLLNQSGVQLDTLAEQVPQFHSAVLAELSLIGHRGPAEVEMQSTSYADDPELLVRMVAKSLEATTSAPSQPDIPLQARPIALLAARQLRDREVRRDKMVRAIWVLRSLLREYGRRLADAGVLKAADDVFYLQVDELDGLPPDASGLVIRRRDEQRSLAAIVPPLAFSGHWKATTAWSATLGVGDTLQGLGVCGGRVRGRVRVVRPETIDDLQPGEILVAEVTDVGYTPAFAYAAAVVTDLGGPMSHAAVVAREFGFPCVVNAHDATRRLPLGALAEVDGTTGEIRVLDLAPDDSSSGPVITRDPDVQR